MKKTKFKFTKSRLTVVLAAAFAMPVAAYAATPAAGQLPGNGYSTTASGTVTGSELAITPATGANVIVWGATKNVTINANSTTPGFNIGAGGTVTVKSATAASSLLSSVRLNLEQIQLVSDRDEFVLGAIRLQGA